MQTRRQTRQRNNISSHTQTAPVNSRTIMIIIDNITARCRQSRNTRHTTDTQRQCANFNLGTQRLRLHHFNSKQNHRRQTRARGIRRKYRAGYCRRQRWRNAKMPQLAACGINTHKRRSRPGNTITNRRKTAHRLQSRPLRRSASPCGYREDNGRRRQLKTRRYPRRYLQCRIINKRMIIRHYQRQQIQPGLCRRKQYQTIGINRNKNIIAVCNKIVSRQSKSAFHYQRPQRSPLCHRRQKIGR